ncbi:MAG: hypothetical protein AB8B53_01240 [Flavobacteriales bacterium]
MNQYDFKADFTNSVFRLMGRIILIVLIVQLITSLLNFLVADFIVDPAIIQKMQSDFEGLDPTNSEEFIEQIQDIFTALLSELNLGFITIATIVGILISMITYNVMYNGIKNEVNSSDNSIGSALNNLLDVRVIKYFIINLLIGIVTVIALGLFFMTSSFILILIGFMFIIPLAVWYTLSNAAVGLGNLSVGRALKLATSNLSLGRIFKVLGIGIVVVIVMAIVGGILGLLTSFLDPFSTLGRVVNMLVGLVTGVPLTAFIIAGFSGLYYRYTDSLKQEEEFLVTD